MSQDEILSMILLIEDREFRQQKAMLRAEYRLEAYADILDNATDERYEEVYEALKEDSFGMDGYDFVIAHSSAFGDDNSLILHKLESLCEGANIPLVLFSGGQSVIYHDSQKRFAHISSLHLYGENLVAFLEAYQKGEEIDMLKLLYSERWRLYLLLRTAERVNLFMSSKRDEWVNFKRFDRECDVSNLLKTLPELYAPQKEGKNISIIEIKKFYESIKIHISETIDA